MTVELTSHKVRGGESEGPGRRGGLAEVWRGYLVILERRTLGGGEAGGLRTGDEPEKVRWHRSIFVQLFSEYIFLGGCQARCTCAKKYPPHMCKKPL